MKQVSQIPTNQLEPNPLQPRGIISPESLSELVESIREHGILEPLIIAETPAGFQIIAGERRWRAARLLKLTHVPAFLRLKEEFGLNNHQIAKKVSKSVPYVINVLKLLNLPDAIKDGLLSGLITEGHARALSSILDTRLMIEAYKIVLKENASVRRAEDIARRMRQKIEEGQIPITKDNLPQFLKSRLDSIGSDMASIFKNKTTQVKVSQTNIYTRVVFQFRGPVEDRFQQLSELYKQICNKELQTDTRQ